MQNTGFLDLLFNLLLGFTVLFFVSFLMIKPMANKADIKTRAEFVVTVAWPNENPDDVDTWLEDPLGGIVWFRTREKNMAHLDRDDLGYLNDTIMLADGSMIKCPRNQEITTIRGIIPGEWVLNVHMYKKRDDKQTPVDVTIDKINPVSKTIFYKKIILKDQWQEETATRFTVQANGDILSLDPLPKKLVKIEGISP